MVPVAQGVWAEATRPAAGGLSATSATRPRDCPDRRVDKAMAQEPQELAANEGGEISYYPQWNTLELRGGQKTRSMTDDGFKQTLQIMAEQGLKVRPKYMIVDSTEFFHTLGEGTLAWRDEHIVPLYNQSGVQKFAFLVTGHAP